MIKKTYRVLKREGWIGFLKIANFILIKTLALPITFILFIISPVIRIRLIQLFSSRIGHYSFNTEAILCALDLNLDSQKREKTFFYTIPNQPICNTQLHDMWRRVIPILPYPALVRQVDTWSGWFTKEKSQSYSIKKTFEPDGDGRDRWDLLEKVKKCHLSFISEEQHKAKKILEKLGIPEGAPFVCLLVRDSNYLSTYLPSCDWSYHNYRDAKINNYCLASEYLAEQGYYVIRMGKHVKDAFEVTHSNIIDYANTSFRSDFMDIYLSAHCYFFLSTCSGLDSVARIFRKPLLVTNLGLPDFDIWHPWNLFIFKKMINEKNNRILSIPEMSQVFSQTFSKRKIQEILRQKKLCFIENTAEEIKSVVIEMIQRLQGTWEEKKENEYLQQLFWHQFPKFFMNTKLHELTIPVNTKIKMRVGSDFLRNSFDLLNGTNLSEVMTH